MSIRRTPAARTLASGSRVDLLHLLQDGGEHTIGELAVATGLHENTTREHLQRLVSDGFAQRAPERRTVRGRPRMVYRAVSAHDLRTDPRAQSRIEESIARVALTRALLDGYGRSVSSPSSAARAAGRAMVIDRDLPPVTASTGTVGVDRQLDALEGHLERLGFDPELDRSQLAFHLYRCPFLDLAKARPEVVCNVHLGLAQGVLDAVPGPVAARELLPFVGPEHCVLQLRRDDVEGRSEPL
ncbi:helix-turn-helix transcriptional regulator [Cellulomonas humilata]|uniref:ArsR family transcriptional regulator n=1 Tax=Cellulomonas humilata TaxID=144055 RepID=A0ABU0EE80_9CELL|nr:helix-turn-helix domain-containing protein [Cellulomonas humilata]MDQ0373558.1 putative ArsR family transcriptional regulator [Cellulomonas humilata]